MLPPLIWFFFLVVFFSTFLLQFAIVCFHSACDTYLLVYSNWYCRGSRLTLSQYRTCRHVARMCNTLYFLNKWYIIWNLYERFFTVRLIMDRKMCNKHLARINEIMLLIQFGECVYKKSGFTMFICPINLCLHIAYVEFSLCYCRSVGDSSWL